MIDVAYAELVVESLRRDRPPPSELGWLFPEPFPEPLWLSGLLSERSYGSSEPCLYRRALTADRNPYKGDE